jgi:hypothetical protein
LNPLALFSCFFFFVLKVKEERKYIYIERKCVENGN